MRRLQGRFEEAVAITLRARDGFRALGLPTMAATCEQTLGWIELSAGNPNAARDALLRSDAILGELGERAVRSTTQALLARALVRLDLRDDAAAAARRAESLSSQSDRVNFAITNEVRARLAINANDAAQAERLAREALSHALATDFVTYQAQARLALAEILFACRKPGDATTEANAAAELFRAKGDRPGLESVDRFLGAVA
jgi:tetratricopeptide (TPR) repeat protein